MKARWAIVALLLAACESEPEVVDASDTPVEAEAYSLALAESIAPDAGPVGLPICGACFAALVGVVFYHDSLQRRALEWETRAALQRQRLKQIVYALSSP